MIQKTEEWYRIWRVKIHGWIAGRVPPVLADVILLTPDLLMLFVGLIGDKRVSRWTKVKLALAIAYVLSPFDIIPEMLLGVIGLTDDAGMMMSLLYGVRNVIGVDEAIIREHWRGNDDVVMTIRTIVTKIENMIPWRRKKAKTA